MNDPLLDQLVGELVHTHKCHTVILYGSRARGDANALSDYDLMGVRKSGKSYRVAKKQRGFYVDIFVYPEKELAKVGEQHLYMNGAKVLIEKNSFGRDFLRKVRAVAARKVKPLPPDEIRVRQVWLHKMFERTAAGDLEGNYRRAWLLEALLYEYFNIRKKRYMGSKASFAWLKENDLTTYKLFDQALARPTGPSLKKLVQRVSKLKGP